MIEASIGELCDIVKGETGIMKATPGQYPLVVTGAERKSSSTFQFDDEAVCIPLVSSTGHGHKSLNYVHDQTGKFALGTILAAVIPKNKSVLSAEYLQRYLQFNKDRVLVPLMTGAANVTLSMKNIAKVSVPIPSIEKQHNYIDLINRIEKQHLNLNTEFNAQSSYLTQLRQAIMQEAIEGKLTTDWRKENPVRKGNPDFDAEALLEKIKAEKEKLVKEGIIKKQKSFAPIKPEDMPFELPEGWVWTRIESMLSNKQYAIKAGPFGSSLTKSMYTTSGFKIYGQEQVIAQDSNIGNYYIDKEKYLELKSCSVDGGDILISLVGTIGKILILPVDIKPGIINPRLIKLSLHDSIDKNYFSILYSSLLTQSQLKNNASGQTMDVINIRILKSILFSIPPFAEQKVIVERVERLLSIINTLEKQNFERKLQAEQVMRTVLWEAFEGES